MKLAIIAAHDDNLVIGKDGQLPWHHKEDMQHFKRITMGHPVIMGRGVFEEVGKKPLPGRKNIVLTRKHDYDNVETAHSIKEALKSLKNENLVFIIGGGEIYKQTIDRVDELYITTIDESHEGDIFFPEYRNDVNSTWKEVWRDQRNKLCFLKYRRKR